MSSREEWEDKIDYKTDIDRVEEEKNWSYHELQYNQHIYISTFFFLQLDRNSLPDEINANVTTVHKIID